jgi:NAD(P)-dependent dehydrogenase (short-subunit alcohol dehydrogenase family)
VMVASELHRVAKLDLDDLKFVKSFSGDQVYCSSKLANILISNEMARKLKGTGILFKISFSNVM